MYRYKCNQKLDGIAIVGSNGEEEGSDDPEISYDCDGAGNYTFDRVNGTNEIILPKCLPRRKYSKIIIAITIIKFSQIKTSRKNINLLLFVKSKHACSITMPLLRIIPKKALFN